MRLSQAPCRHPMVLYDWPAEVLKPRGSTVLPGMALCTSEGEIGQHDRGHLPALYGMLYYFRQSNRGTGIICEIIHSKSQGCCVVELCFYGATLLPAMTTLPRICYARPRSFLNFQNASAPKLTANILSTKNCDATSVPCFCSLLLFY